MGFKNLIMFRPIAIIPHYRHIHTLPQVVNALRSHNLPVLIIDDGSGEAYHADLERLRTPDVNILYSRHNQGKGGAMKQGLLHAQLLGYTHALQIDADAQHCFNDIPRFIQTAQSRPNAMICAHPIYGEDAPKIRLYGRKITNFWNMIHTHSTAIKEGMCGFRVYPIDSTCHIIKYQYIGNRMDFDNEILVHLFWQNIPLIWLPTPVHYQADGISHFRSWQDNWLISKMHTRLFFYMLFRMLGKAK